MNLLKTINSPKDLKALSQTQLIELAGEVRSYMIEAVSKTGGHLAPSLGAVDFTIALHYILNAPDDKIIWDVGHQAYCHKILTGRREAFKGLRQKNGISGFPNIDESEYDAFTVGHGSTSISTALGLVCGRDVAGSDEKIVAVIGDGALGGGMAFEGLNHAGQLHKDLLIILNDNEFSISPSVGAFSHYLNRVISNPTYNRVRADVDRLIRRVPKLGFRLSTAARKLEEGLKNLLVPGMLFEEMGLRYFGPVDGHNMGALIEVIRNVLPQEGPKIIHVITKKGKGLKFAEDNPSKFHGTAPFNIGDGSLLSSSKPSFTKTFSNKMIDLAEKNKKIVAVTAAMPEGTGLDKFERAFPNRFFNVGMAEEHAVGFAAGLSKKGLVPVVAIYSSFLQRAYDQIIHDVCLQNLHMIICLDRAGVVGEDGPTHHGVFDISYLRHIPNLVCMAPKDHKEFEMMLDFASQHKGPISIRYPRGDVIDEDGSSIGSESIVLGKSEVLRVGDKIAILAIGDMVAPSVRAAQILSEENIHAEVVNMRFIKPIDCDKILNVADKAERLIVVEDNALTGGFGSAVCEVLSDSNKSIPVERIGIPDEFVTYDKREALLDSLGLSSKKIAKKVIECLK